MICTRCTGNTPGIASTLTRPLHDPSRMRRRGRCGTDGDTKVGESVPLEVLSWSVH